MKFCINTPSIPFLFQKPSYDIRVVMTTKHALLINTYLKCMVVCIVWTYVKLYLTTLALDNYIQLVSTRGRYTNAKYYIK